VHKKKAIITGILGQDGTYLCEYLLKKKYSVLGIARKSPSAINSQVVDINLNNSQDIFNLLDNYSPDEIYHLAAFHHSSEEDIDNSFDIFRKSFDTHIMATLNLLEGLRRFSKDTKLFYAGSSLMFGNTVSAIQNEKTPFNPTCVYGITKLAGANLCQHYRDFYGIFASVGILYNHESPLRSSKFVSKKIVEAAIDIKAGRKNKLVIGNLGSKIDWGYAPDYIEAMYSILQNTTPDDFIISSENFILFKTLL